jgi:hypothetical protein
MRTTHKWMTILATLSAILFGLSLTFSLFAFNIQNQLFNPDVYKKAFAEQNVCARFPDVISHQIVSSAQSKDKGNLLGLIIGSINPDQLRGVIQSVLPCPIVEKFVFGGIDQIFSQINLATAQQGLSLNSIKQSLQQKSSTVVDEFLKSQPDCTAAQLLQIGTDALLGKGVQSGTILCNPPAPLREVLSVPIGLMMDAAIQGLPDQIPLSSGFVNSLNSLRIIRIALNWSFVLPLIFLGLTTVLAVRSWRSLLQWWGIPLLVSGLTALVISLTASPIFYELLTGFLFPNLPANLVPEAITLISDVLSSVVNGLVRPIQIQSAVIGLIGLVMVVGERISRAKPS